MKQEEGEKGNLSYQGKVLRSAKFLHSTTGMTLRTMETPFIIMSDNDTTPNSMEI